MFRVQRFNSGFELWTTDDLFDRWYAEGYRDVCSGFWRFLVEQQLTQKEVTVMALTARSPMSAPTFYAVISLISILCYLGGAEGAFAAETHRPFATFGAKVEIDIEDGEIDMLATFALGADNNGFDLPKETVSLQVTGSTGAYSVTIPAGSFKAERGGAFKFQGTINRVKIDTSLRPARNGAFEFEVETEGANLKGFANPVTLTLIIGDDGGSRTVRAEIE